MPERETRDILVIDGTWHTKMKTEARKTKNGNWMFHHGVGYDDAPHVVKKFEKGEEVIRTITLMNFPGQAGHSTHPWVPCGVVINESAVLVNPQKDGSEFSREFYFGKV